VPFSGTVANECSIIKTSDGVVVSEDPPRSSQYDYLMTDASGGSRGVVEITCTGTGRINVSPVFPTGSTSAPHYDKSCLYDVATGGTVKACASPSIIGTHVPGTATYYVGMEASRAMGVAWGVGTHSFRVQVRITAD
jgi:hypothetical protein